MINVEDILAVVGDEMNAVANGDAVVGSPVKLGPATAYPISLISLGLGGGGGEGENASGADGKKELGAGNGAGGGVKARPVAVLVFTEDDVSVLPIPRKAGPLERFIEGLPDLLQRFKDKAEKAKAKG